MSIKTYRPTTPARRNMTVSGFDGVDKHVKPEKTLVEVLKKHAGRNSYGHITVRHQGGGRSTASSTSSATSWTSRARSSAWSTTPTAAPSSPWWNTPTASAATFWLLWA